MPSPFSLCFFSDTVIVLALLKFHFSEGYLIYMDSLFAWVCFSASWKYFPCSFPCLRKKCFLLCLVGRVCVPKQLVIKKDPTLIPAEVAKAGLKLPLGMLSQLSCDVMLLMSRFLKNYKSSFFHLDIWKLTLDSASGILLILRVFRCS